MAWGLCRHIVIAGLPRHEPGIHSIWEWIEGHSLVVYPSVVLLVIMLIAGAMFAAWQAEDMTAEQRAELKAKIMGVMRRRVSGVSAELVAAELQIDIIVADTALREMVEEGLVGVTSTAEALRYRIRRAT